VDPASCLSLSLGKAEDANNTGTVRPPPAVTAGFGPGLAGGLPQFDPAAILGPTVPRSPCEHDGPTSLGGEGDRRQRRIEEPITSPHQTALVASAGQVRSSQFRAELGEDDRRERRRMGPRNHRKQ
jgi:hypothetical protein